MFRKPRTATRAAKCTRTFAVGLVNLHSCLLLPLIYIKCEWLLNTVEGLVQELGNSPFLKTQWNRGRTAYVGIWMVNRWITQSDVFPCRLAGIVLWNLCICARERERWGMEEWGFILPHSITQWSKIFAMPGGILKNIWKKKKKIQYRADLLLGVCKEIHSASNLVQS